MYKSLLIIICDFIPVSLHGSVGSFTSSLSLCVKEPTRHKNAVWFCGSYVLRLPDVRCIFLLLHSTSSDLLLMPLQQLTTHSVH